MKTVKDFFARQPLALLCATVLLATLAWSSAFYLTRMHSMRRTIDVKGTANLSVSADLARWSIKIASRSPGRKESYDALVQQEQLVHDFLLQHGVEAREIARGVRQTQPLTRFNEKSGTQEEYGFESSLGYAVTTSDVQKLGNIAESLNEYAIQRDITLSDNSVEYFYTKLESIKKELLEKAIINAKERAQALGKVTGSSIGRVESASQGIFQVNAAGDLSVSDYGNFNTSSIGKEVLVTISVSFEVE